MKQHLFTLHAWYCWAIHSIVVLGTLTLLMLIAMQWSGIEVAIRLPLVEHYISKH